MTVGRKPTPTALKLVKGNPGKRAVNQAEAVVAMSEPTPPAFLCDDAKVEWGRVCSALYAAGLMTELDRAALAAYCAAYGRWAQAEHDPELYGQLCNDATAPIATHAIPASATA